MPCTRGCCSSPAEHYRSVATRVGAPKSKVTVEDTGATVNTVTEHWHDRQDVHVKVVEPVTYSRSQGGS